MEERSSDEKLLWNSMKATKAYSDEQNYVVWTMLLLFWSFYINLKAFSYSLSKPQGLGVSEVGVQIWDESKAFTCR